MPVFFHQKSLPTINTSPILSITQGKIGLIDESGNAWVLGYNYYGDLGINNLVDQAFFVQPAKTDIPWKMMSLGVASFFLDTNGMIWGSGGYNQGVGDNSTTNRSSPVTIARSASYNQIATGTNGNVYVAGAIDDSNGTIWMWGSNTNGTLGDNTTTAKSSPVSIAKSASWTKFSIGMDSAAVAIDGSTGLIWTWGYNVFGQLGDNTTTAKSSPVSIKRSASYSAVVNTNYSAIAIDASNGSLWTWGQNSNGELGDNTTVNKSSPVSVLIAGSFIQVAKSTTSSYALDSAGVLWSWGANNVGQLGDGTLVNKSSPISIVSNIKFIAASKDIDDIAGITSQASDNVVFIDNNGIIKTCGSLSWGQFNTNFAGSGPQPRSVPFSYKYTISPSPFYRLFVGLNGAVYSYGVETSGCLGLNTAISTPIIVPTIIARSASYSQVASSYIGNFNGAIDGSNGSIWMWGNGSAGKLGDGTSTNKSSPVSVIRAGSYKTISCGNSNSGAIDALDGSVWVWGSGSIGGTSCGLGNNTTGVPRSSPVAIARAGSYSELFIGYGTSYMVDASNGMIWGWGYNAGGMVGDNTLTNRSSPVALARSASYRNVATGSSTTSGAIDASTGMIWTWGNNIKGNLGNGQNGIVSSPVALLRSGSYKCLVVQSTSAGAIDASNGSVWMWGDNTKGQCGPYADRSAGPNVSSPVSIPIAASCVSITLTSFSCTALDYTGTLWGWGANDLGMIAYDSQISIPISIGKVILK